ncbi:TPA: hypothetical protein ACH3X2_008985 [Trebouxia sp. C0005]
MTRCAFCLLTLITFVAVPSCMAQDDPYDTTYPANYTGPGAESVPTSASDGWHFPRPLITAPDTYPTAGSAGQGFTAVACGSTDTGYLVSYRMSYTPEGSQDYVVHLSLLIPYPNNITGRDTGPTQQIFTIAADTWLNLRTGFVAGLNTTQSAGTVYTFNSSLNGQVAKELVRADSTVYSTVHSINRDAFFGVSSNSNGANGLSYYLYPPPAYNSVEAEGLAANSYNWMQNVESLRFYTGLIAMQGSRTTSCTTDTRGWYELAPLLDYLTLILKTVTVSTDFSEYSAQYLGQLNTSYVQTNPEVSPQIYATLKTPSVYIPVDTPILDPALGLTESECIVRAKNYTLTRADVQGTPPANVWDYCSTGVCNYNLANGTQGTFVSPYAGTHTTSICQMGYSAAVDSNEYVEPAYITGTGQGTAGESAASVCLPVHVVAVSGKKMLVCVPEQMPGR